MSFNPPYFTDSNTKWFAEYLPRVKRHAHMAIAVKNVAVEMRFFVIPDYKNAALTEIKRITGDTALDMSCIDISGGLDILKAQKMLGNTIRNVYLSDKRGAKRYMVPGIGECRKP